MIAMPVIAHAQEHQLLPTEAPRFDMERYTAVRDRKQPGYEAPGIPLGGFTLSPSIEAAAIIDDNIFAQEAGRVGDQILQIRPEATLQSNWSRHSLALRADGLIDRHARRSTENIEDIDLGATGVLDLGDATRVRIGVRDFRGHQSRQSQDAFAQTLRPIRYATRSAALAVTKDLGRIRLSTDATFARRNYHDGTLADGSVYDQDASDSDSYRVGARLSYAPSPSTSLFVRVLGDWRNFRVGTAETPKRDSHGYQVLAGVEFEPAALIRGSIGIGYIRQKFRDPFYTDLSGLAVNAKLLFFPTQLMTVTAKADRQVLDSGIPGSGGYLSTSSSVGVDYELLRQLILGASVGYQDNRFNNLDRRDGRVTVSARGTWRLNRNLALELRYERLDQTSQGRDRYRSFADNRLMLGVTLRR